MYTTIVKASLPRLFLGVILGIAIAATSNILNPEFGPFNSLWPSLLGLMVTSFSLLTLQAKIHAGKMEFGFYIEHSKANLLRIGVATVICLLFHAGYTNWMKMLDFLIFSMFYSWLVFDLAINHYRDLNPFYLGKDGKHASFVDSIFNGLKYGGEVLFVLKLIGLVLSSYVYLILD